MKIIKILKLFFIMNYLHRSVKGTQSSALKIWKNMVILSDMVKRKLWLPIIGLSLAVFVIIILIHNKSYPQCCNHVNLPLDFTNFDNVTGTSDGCYIVPNFLHFIRFKGVPISYLHMICYLAAFKNQKPQKIFFHYDNKTTFTGKYWEILKNTPGFIDITVLNHIEMPTEIFGQELSTRWREFHGSDITRIRVLMEYGGIFLDNDSYLVRSFDDFRRFECSINWDDGGQSLGTQLIVAHKDARFLKEWLETYREYHKEQWYYNAGKRPTVEILYKKPELIHRVKFLFGVHNSLIVNVFKLYWPQWKYMYGIHLLHRHMNKLGNYAKELPSEFDEQNVKDHKNTFREMALDVYNPDNSHFTY